ncbi:hypothetical protein L210DRAFT_3560596 [Boletus edulis BED1]|uniref:RBR-type E3 ubiquitin transferase n=1 Tax=Boletus edulis BED1 TaxID=1328754 RepID=A0AAD4BHP9_BOLED|nr:hypothetical protein L210DRAFT_3560596 [Boletus edulis BED1]
MARWLGTVMDRHVVEELLSPREQLTGTQAIRLEEMHRVPLFEGALRHVATQHSPPSMILFKQSLRQMQLHPSPVSAIVVNRSASTTVCLKLREHSRDVFCVLDFALAPQEHVRRHGTALALVISTSLEQTAARMSGNLPVDNHLMTRDAQWQAQLFASCTMCMFTPAEGAAWLSEAESSATISGSVSLLRIMDEMDDRGQDCGRARDGNRDRDQHRRDRPSGSKHSERWARTPVDAGRTATTSRRHASHVEGESTGEGSSARMAGLRPRPMFTPYEQTKRHCRIFLSDDELSSPMSPISRLSEASDEEAYFACVICFEDIPEGQGIRLLPCTHGFCRDCLAGHVCSKIEERKFPVFCPLCMTEHENASPSVVAGDMVQRLGVSEAQYTVWSELEMAHLCVRVHCRRCDRVAFVDKEDYEELEEFRVTCSFPGCEHTWCKNCQQTLSSGDGPKHSCDGTEELDYLVRQMGWKYCPKCRTPVQKNGGCNHVTCVTPGCNTHFCYRCGKQITRTSIPFLVRSAVNAHFKQCTL